MGLPSGLLWASCNVGAENPVDLGLYFSWGNVEGHMLGEGYDFSQNEYETTPGAAVAANLTLEEDAARVVLGEPWRMPSIDEFQELYDNCTIVWSTMDGVRGLLFTSNVNGHTIFFPAAGDYDGTSLVGRGTYGLYWSSTYGSATSASCLNFSSTTVNLQSGIGRRRGLSVRAVLQPT